MKIKKTQTKKDKELKAKKPEVKQPLQAKVHKVSAPKKAKVVPLKKEKPLSLKKTVSKKVAPDVVKEKEVVRATVLPEKIIKKEQVLAKERVTKKVTPVKVISPEKPQQKIETEKPPKKTTAVLSEAVKEKPVVAEKIKEPVVIQAPKPKKNLKPLEVNAPITVKDLAVKIQEKSSVLIKYLIEKQKMFVTINQILNEEIVIKTLEDFGFEYKKRMTDEESLMEVHTLDSGKELLPRPPVITLMGHVDHGKTSLLDAIRRSNVAEKEHGGITQHIGAYGVETKKGKITFLDTPGHEAFTAMRARGANITDIVILVVAADDGIMPQTIEAIDHARAAGVPIVVAINKIDKQSIDLDKVKRQLSQHDLMPEDWGGKTITIGVSAKTGQGIDELLDMILLEAEMLELKAIYDKPASGVVIEAKLSKGQGLVVTALVQSGSLKTGDNIICGLNYGKIRAMINSLGQRIDIATPSMAVEILGLSGLPEAGEKFYVLTDEKRLKEIVDQRQMQARQERLTIEPKLISLEDLYSKIQKGEVKELNLILKADVQGSLEAIKESLAKLISAEVKLNILHSSSGPINSSDVILAEASNAIIIGFHVEPDTKAKELAAEKKVEIRTYRIIYELISEIKAALEGLLAPKIKKIFIGKAIVKKVFNLSKSGIVAGCLVQKGKITRQAAASLVRDGQVIFEGNISALKRFKDDVREVAEEFECGISLSGFSDYKEGDIIEAYGIEKIARTL
ncbi:MAG: translation initiation factor IF-2 [Candidatus Omnitrophica bacterium]|nr:translation initiation factor IF-2 [Candidatus Omnitrophota bacterium]MDD5351870.1 translation initiation factor IF-2 [Candidatus Omnitrophota bacterium]MDD5550696.1 translation initiation factor IF-2 [Candidatus Omnitrophota bacterium]